MFTAWDHVRTLEGGRGGDTLPLAALEVTKRRGCSLLPTPGGARLSSVPLELLMEGRGFFFGFFFWFFFPLPCPLSVCWGWHGCCWLGDTPVVTRTEPELPPGRGGCPSLCRVAVSFPTITAELSDNLCSILLMINSVTLMHFKVLNSNCPVV